MEKTSGELLANAAQILHAVLDKAVENWHENATEVGICEWLGLSTMQYAAYCHGVTKLIELGPRAGN